MRNSRRAGKPAGRKPEKQGLTGLFTKGKNIPTTAQQTLPYREMYRDGVCRVADRYYTKTIEYEDINYQLAQSEDQAAIFDGFEFQVDITESAESFFFTPFTIFCTFIKGISYGIITEYAK